MGRRTARIRAKLSASDALTFVALRPEIVGMALAEPGRLAQIQYGCVLSGLSQGPQAAEDAPRGDLQEASGK